MLKLLRHGARDMDTVLLRARGIAALRGVLDSPVARDLLALLELLRTERPDPEAVARVVGRLWEGLAVDDEYLLPDAWQSHIVSRVLDDENPFSLGAEKGETRPVVLEQARRDLRTLRELFALDAATLLRMVESTVPDLAGVWVHWTNPEPAEESPRHTIARKLSAAGDWGACAELLVGHYARHGAGPFGHHRAFRWREGRLRAISRPDPVRLAELVAYEREREPLLRNTERFLAGLPAHHALLYGLPGTGKSSTVKAVLNEYADDGLRLVEVTKEDLSELPRVLDALRGRGPRFVLFIDDLSFEEHEVEYKALKALFEGSVEEPPENVRLYATSNRRNVVRENFSDRERLRRRRPRPRHHAGEALPRGPLRPARHFPGSRPETLPRDSRGSRRRTRHQGPRGRAAGSAPSCGTAGTQAARAAPPASSWTSSRQSSPRAARPLPNSSIRKHHLSPHLGTRR